MSVGTSSDGGYLAPVEWDRQVRKAQTLVSPMRRLATVITTGVGAFSTVWSDNAWGSGWVGETAARPATANPALSTLEFASGEIYANVAITQRLAPLAVLLALAGGCLFIDRALAVAELRPWISSALRAQALAAGLTAAAFALDLVSYRAASLVATVLGPLSMLLAIPVAYRRARQGERVGLYMLVGWGFYAVATLTIAGLLRGWVPSNFWTQHAFQFGSMFEMAMWMRVLGVRIEDLRASAQRVHLEHAALRSMAHTDALTGLPNRRGLNETLARVLPASVPERMTAVYLVDLDGFKPVNDRLGHDVGDALLIAVARRLESLVRGSDTVARLGGDEFVIVATRLASDADAQSLGRKLLAGFAAPFALAGQECRVGLTVGYALAPLDGSDALSLLKRADAAMYAGKQAGKNCMQRGAASAGLVTA